jgi:hypothetical protein
MVKNQAEQGNQLATPEELKQRADALERKRLQRRREAAAKLLHVRSQNRAQFWADNRAALKPAELQALEARQDEFVRLASQVNEVIDGLKSDSAIGPPDGLPFIDVLFEEMQAYVARTNPTGRLVLHLSPEEFSQAYEPENAEIIKLLNFDEDYWLYGAYTMFKHTTCEDYVRVCADFIRANPGHLEIDESIAADILAERAKREPRRPVQAVVRNTPEDYRSPDGSEPEWVELQNDKERLRSMRDLSKMPFRNS